MRLTSGAKTIGTMCAKPGTIGISVVSLGMSRLPEACMPTEAATKSRSWGLPGYSSRQIELTESCITLQDFKAVVALRLRKLIINGLEGPCKRMG